MANLNKLKIMFKAFRIKHWVKNILIFIPAILSSDILNFEVFFKLVIGFVSFGMIASSMYVLNDIRDVHHDRIHPLKRDRAIASGRIKLRKILFVSFFFFLASLISSWMISFQTLQIIFFYFILNWIYSVYLKKERYLDILVLSLFHIIRIFFGASISGTELTSWFLLTSLMIFLSVSLRKRYLEIKIMKSESLNGRVYSQSDFSELKTLSLLFAFTSLIFLNIHYHFFLKVTSHIELIALNIFSCGGALLYFDDSNKCNDDMVSDFYGRPRLLIFVLSYVLLYLSIQWFKL